MEIAGGDGDRPRSEDGIPKGFSGHHLVSLCETEIDNAAYRGVSNATRTARLVPAGNRSAPGTRRIRARNVVRLKHRTGFTHFLVATYKRTTSNNGNDPRYEIATCSTHHHFVSVTPRVTLGIVTNFINALSSAPRTAFNPESNTTPVPITAASLLLNQIGIYKVSFTLPIPKDPIIPCDGDVRSNSLLLVTTSLGVEAIGLCVQQ